MKTATLNTRGYLLAVREYYPAQRDSLIWEPNFKCVLGTAQRAAERGCTVAARKVKKGSAVDTALFSRDLTAADWQEGAYLNKRENDRFYKAIGV